MELCSVSRVCIYVCVCVCVCKGTLTVYLFLHLRSLFCVHVLRQGLEVHFTHKKETWFLLLVFVVYKPHLTADS